MNRENVPTSDARRKPPCHRTIASAREEARFIVTAKAPRRRAARMPVFLISEVSFTKSSAIRSSITSVLIVFAPVMPSLKSPVIRLFSSRIRRLASISFFWNRAYRTTISGRISMTRSASRALTASMTASAPTRKVACQTHSIRLQETSVPMRPVSLMTREWIQPTPCRLK